VEIKQKNSYSLRIVNGSLKMVIGNWERLLLFLKNGCV